MATNQQLRALLNEMAGFKATSDEHASVVITDPQGKTACVNDTFCAISKHSHEELPL